MTSNVALQTSAQDQAVLDAADVSAVSQLIVRERLSRDLGLWEQMHDCYHEDSVVRLSWINASGPEFVRRSKDMAARNVKATHRLGPVLVTLAGDRAIAQLGGVIDIPSKVRGVAVIFSSYTRFFVSRRTPPPGLAALRLRCDLSAGRNNAGHSGPDRHHRAAGAEEISSVVSSAGFLRHVGRLSGARRSCRR